jgi:hypothetical protein
MNNTFQIIIREKVKGLIKDNTNYFFSDIKKIKSAQNRINVALRDLEYRYFESYATFEFKYLFQTKDDIFMRDYKDLATIEFKAQMKKYILENITEEQIFDFIDRFRENMQKNYRNDSFLRILVTDINERINKTVLSGSKRNFNLRTGELHYMFEPPMGNNEFLRKIVDKDIFNTELLKEA